MKCTSTCNTPLTAPGWLEAAVAACRSGASRRSVRLVSPGCWHPTRSVTNISVTCMHTDAQPCDVKRWLQPLPSAKVRMTFDPHEAWTCQLSLLPCPSPALLKPLNRLSGPCLTSHVMSGYLSKKGCIMAWIFGKPSHVPCSDSDVYVASSANKLKT